MGGRDGRWAYVSRVVGVDEATGFDVAVNSDGEACYLSPCCGASAKGCNGYTGCRACYEPIDPRIGDLPPEEWWAPHQRHRVSSFNDFLIGLIAKSARRVEPTPPKPTLSDALRSLRSRA